MGTRHTEVPSLNLTGSHVKADPESLDCGTSLLLQGCPIRSHKCLPESRSVSTFLVRVAQLSRNPVAGNSAGWFRLASHESATEYP